MCEGGKERLVENREVLNSAFSTSAAYPPIVFLSVILRAEILHGVSLFSTLCRTATYPPAVYSIGF